MSFRWLPRTCSGASPTTSRGMFPGGRVYRYVRRGARLLGESSTTRFETKDETARRNSEFGMGGSKMEASVSLGGATLHAVHVHSDSVPTKCDRGLCYAANDTMLRSADDTGSRWPVEFAKKLPVTSSYRTAQPRIENEKHRKYARKRWTASSVLAEQSKFKPECRQMLPQQALWSFKRASGLIS